MKTILIVQEEPLLIEVFKRTLSNYRLLDATSAVQAMDVYRRCPKIDLLITDMVLPVVSGMELASLLKAWLPELQVILTADTPAEYWSTEQTILFGEISSESVAVLEKPFLPAQLREQVAVLIGPPAAVPSIAVPVG